ncbi:hypothetical protein NDU88_005709 [Pleurodeles waltl]|uniref:Uncharacterized protein n=1 Tax=Pleurodeles waltl TaxID=8319 RepID=A0AAV7PGH6_PLEWA|nr:hypothetical protein NDU88_005709 [Pleurodeles waltl]
MVRTAVPARKKPRRNGPVVDIIVDSISGCEVLVINVDGFAVDCAFFGGVFDGGVVYSGAVDCAFVDRAVVHGSVDGGEILVNGIGMSTAIVVPADISLIDETVITVRIFKSAVKGDVLNNGFLNCFRHRRFSNCFEME